MWDENTKGVYEGNTFDKAINRFWRIMFAPILFIWDLID